jgi:hypothetical protein
MLLQRFFVAGFVGLLIILLYFSAVITQLTREARIAAQQIGILRERVDELENGGQHFSDDK